MKHALAIAMACLAGLGAVGMAAAAEALPQDETEIQTCIEGVREYNAGAEAGQEASRDECIGTVAGPCLETDDGMTTIGMVACYGRELAVWDAMLNMSYGALKDDLSPEAFAALRDTQVKWIAFRDAKCAWPSVLFEGGSIARPIGADCLNRTTAQRANELADYLDWTQN
jgi:uncharacterized protein YecT (DUF1311 family)